MIGAVIRYKYHENYTFVLEKERILFDEGNKLTYILENKDSIYCSFWVRNKGGGQKFSESIEENIF